MVHTLEERGFVDSGFLERLEQREEQSTMVFTGGVALPHTVQYATDRLTLAVGVLPKGIRSAEREVNVVFLLGLPEQLDEEDNLLIRIYDEIITIAQDSELRERIAAADNYQTLLQALYREAQ
jgi:lichenan operon transcriptional antiterminator